MQSPSPERPQSERLVAIGGVAVAGIIQISSTEGPFNFWNVMIGVPLLLLLAIYDPHGQTTHRERIAWASIWGFTLTSALGILFQSAYRVTLGLRPILPPFPEPDEKWEAPSEYYFVIWLVLSAIAYAYFRPRGLR